MTYSPVSSVIMLVADTRDTDRIALKVPEDLRELCFR